MKNIFRPIICLCLFTAMSFAGPTVDAQEKQTSKIKTSAVMVEKIRSDAIALPAEFQVALYENLVQQLGKKGSSWHVYRDGDRNTVNIPDIVVLRSTVRSFKQGSERQRQVTTVAGATSITIHCEFSNNQGKVLLERDIQGKVRFMGGNLKATYDFAKKAAAVARENFAVNEPT